MNIWKVLVMVCVAALLAILGIWAVHGFEIYTKTSVAVVTVDELFGTESEEWVDQFVLGFLPSGTSLKEMTGVVSLGAPFALLLLFAVFKMRKPGAGQT